MSATASRVATSLPSRAVVVRATLWLLFLAPFFYASYGFANWMAAQRPDVGSIVFGWEHAIPFLPWTIVPYWSINLFYGLALLANDTTAEVDRLAGRYLTAQVVAVACFLAFPLTATFARPEVDGLPGVLFAVLGGFDKPFNQAPSLHIALLIIIWDQFRRRFSGAGLIVWHAWCVLIALSVLTTWQHHFIDIPAGALLGLFTLWLFPREGALPVAGARLTRNRKARRLALIYAAGAVVLLAAGGIGALHAPESLLLLWPALSLAIVACAYATHNPAMFQKRPDGTVSLASRILFLPYRLGARLNIRFWTRRLDPHVEIMDGVRLGRFPSAASECSRFATVIDLTAELVRPAGTECRWISLPMLDLVPPSASERSAAAEAMEDARIHGPVLVCCALGFQRSASAVATWLLRTGRVTDGRAAEALLVSRGRPVRLPDDRTA